MAVAATDPLTARGAEPSESLPARARATAKLFASRVVLVLGMLFLLALSLLPLSALLLILPAVMPEETVLTDSASRARSPLVRFGRRLFALAAGAVALVALVLFAIEVVGWLPLPEKGSYNGLLPTLASLFLSKEGAAAFKADVIPALPPALVQHWPYVVLVVYLVDVLLMISIGKVPLAYNSRNMIVRWRITVLTALAFTVVVGLLTVLLAFVNGMDQLTEKSGIPGNVFVLSDGSTDEVFSNLGFGDVDNVERETVKVDPKGRPLPETIGVKRVRLGEREVSLFSKETYCVVNQQVPNPAPGRPPRRFVQVRGVEDAEICAAVHNVGLLPGGRWFDPTSGVRPPPDGKGSSWIEAVIGEGVAGTLGSDKGKPRLEVGDTFEMGDRTWVVTGILFAEGSTFGSEVWAKQQQVGELFRKKNFTTVALRVSDESAAGAKAMAYHLRNHYTVQKLKAQTETEYYSELGKSNQAILVVVIVVAVVMAIGGVFGVMNTMFAAIAQRTKDIGVLRLLGFKRWQVLVSFMLESFGIALIGGLLGCLIGGLLADGRTAQSIVSGGQGSGKTVILRLTVNADIVMAGVLFTLVMGRLGGLVPALSAMRLKILESLR